MTDAEFAQILTQTLALGHETTGIEFKGPGPRTNRRLFAQVVRAILGMSNRRDGGLVILGVEDADASLRPVGLNQDDLDTWRFDDVSDRVASYADPAVSFELETREYNSERYLVFGVDEFADVPVLCKRDYPDVLRNGACYVRTRRKPETSEIPTQSEMRDLLELATEKSVRRFLTQAQRAGITPHIPAPPTDQERFDQQLGDLR